MKINPASHLSLLLKRLAVYASMEPVPRGTVMGEQFLLKLTEHHDLKALLYVTFCEQRDPDVVGEGESLNLNVLLKMTQSREMLEMRPHRFIGGNLLFKLTKTNGQFEAPFESVVELMYPKGAYEPEEGLWVMAAATWLYVNVLLPWLDEIKFEEKPA